MAAEIQNLASFNGSNGRNPVDSLTLGTDGLFYGTTTSGGSSNFGTIFSFNPSGNVLSSLASFNGSNGRSPLASLTLGNNGLFYGTTPIGGRFDQGTIFSFNPTSNVLSSLASFNGSNGTVPRASLTLGNNGLFYGTTQSGGSFDRGTIFSFNPSGNVLSSLASFNVSNGFGPRASLTLGNNGLFYGTTINGGISAGNGTIFSFNPTGNVLSSLASFNGSNGRSPEASLTLGTDGLFYGTTTSGGSSEEGTIFSFNPTGNALSSLASFNGSNGRDPRASLTLGPDGLFYGTAIQGGSSDRGTIFSFDAGLTPPLSVIEPSSLLGLLSLGTALTFKRRKTSNSTPRERNTNS
jgi:uncharacterized repeat protein (TIGR03803 family)